MAAPMSQALDPNLIRQLEEAYYGQTDATQPPAIDLAAMQQMPASPAPQTAPRPMRQMPTQEDLNIKNQEANAPSRPLTLAEQLSQAYEQQQGLQSEAIRTAEEQLAAARGRPQQMDLSPLIALAESWSQKPSGLLRAYRPPTDQAKTVQALQEAVLKARGGASELARMRAKDVANLEMQQEQMKTNEDLKRLQITAMGQQKEVKQDLSQQKFARESEKEYTKTYGESLRNLAVFGGKVAALEKKITEKGDPFFGYDADEINSLSSTINTDYNRDIGQLGALAGADLELIKAATGQGVSVQDYVKRQMGGGAKSRINLLKMLKRDAAKRVELYKNEIMSNSDYEYVAKRLDNDVSAFERATGQKISGDGESAAKAADLTTMTREQKIEAAKRKMEGK
jgi:hypothetical protein